MVETRWFLSWDVVIADVVSICAKGKYSPNDDCLLEVIKKRLCRDSKTIAEPAFSKLRNEKRKSPQNLIWRLFVVSAGIEPATQGFSVLCSTNWAMAPCSSVAKIWISVGNQRKLIKITLLRWLIRSCNLNYLEPKAFPFANISKIPIQHLAFFYS